MALPYSDSPLACLAAALAVLVGIFIASVRGWIRPFSPICTTGVILGAQLAGNAFFLYADGTPVRVAASEPDVKAAATAAAAAADAGRPLFDGEYTWLFLLVVAGCVLGCVVVAVFRFCVEASRGRRRRMVPLVPGGSRRAVRRASCCGWRILVELVLFVVSVWACVYFFSTSPPWPTTTWLQRQ